MDLTALTSTPGTAELAICGARTSIAPEAIVWLVAPALTLTSLKVAVAVADGL